MEERYVSDLTHLTGFYFLHPFNSEEFNGTEGVHVLIYLLPEVRIICKQLSGQQGQAEAAGPGNDFHPSFRACGSPSALRTGGKTRGIRQVARTALPMAALAPRNVEQSCWSFASILWAAKTKWRAVLRPVLLLYQSLFGHLFWQKSLGGGVAHKSYTWYPHTVSFWRNGSCHAGVCGHNLTPAETMKGTGQQELAVSRSSVLQAQDPCFCEDFWRRSGQHTARDPSPSDMDVLTC